MLRDLCQRTLFLIVALYSTVVIYNDLPNQPYTKGQLVRCSTYKQFYFKTLAHLIGGEYLDLTYISLSVRPNVFFCEDLTINL